MNGDEGSGGTASDQKKMKSKVIERDGARSREAHELPEWLGKGLREMYDDVLNDPVPDDMRDLLDKLDQ